jgi:hypothetical protein
MIHSVFCLSFTNFSVALAHRVSSTVVTFAPMVSRFRMLLLQVMAKVSPVPNLLLGK